MADTLEEFYRGEILAQDVVEGRSVTLLTTGANTSAVIKDLQLENRSGFDIPPLDLTVNGHIVGTFNDSAEGSEIVGPNSTVKLACRERGFFDFKYQIAQSAAVIALAEQNTLAGEAVIAADELVALGFTMSASTYLTAYLDPAKAYLTVGSWDGNSSTQVYKYNMSTKGQIQLSTAGYGGMPCLGGDGYIYRAVSNKVVRMKLDDASGFFEFGPTITNYPRTTSPTFATNQVPSSDGNRCFVHSEHSGVPVYYHFRNPATGAKIGSEIQLGTANAGFWASVSNSFCHPFYSDARAKWMIAYSKGSVLRVADLPAASVTDQFNARAQITLPSTTGSIACLGDSILFFDKASGDVLEYDLDLKLMGVIEGGRAEVKGMMNTQKIDVVYGRPTDAEIAARDYSAQPKFSVRLTGIKTA